MPLSDLGLFFLFILRCSYIKYIDFLAFPFEASACVSFLILVSRCPCFARAVLCFAGRCVQSFDDGDYIIRQGEEGTRFFIINEGEVSKHIKYRIYTCVEPVKETGYLSLLRTLRLMGLYFAAT